MTTTPDFRALCKELGALMIDLASTHPNLSENGVRIVNELSDRADAALATPPPEPPTDEAWQEFIEQVQRAQHVAIREGECPRFDLVECALALWRETIPPPPEPPTDEELLAMRSWSSHSHTFDSDLVDFARAVLERWGHR
jgi:hypothetical protein